MRTWGLVGLTAIVAAAVLLALAVAITRHALDAHATQQAAAYTAGGSPWRWALRSGDDLVAGHAFGAARLTSAPHALHARSVDGSSYTLGLPLARAIDLRRLPRLHIDLAKSAPFSLRIVLRQRLNGPLLISTPVTVRPQESTVDANLRALAWNIAGSGPSAAPDRAAMLRLRLRHAAGTRVALRAVAVLPARGEALEPASPPYASIPSSAADVQTAVAKLARAPPLQQVPVFLLPSDAGATAMLRRRDQIRDAVPAAIVAADAHWRAARAGRWQIPFAGVIAAIALYALGLAVLLLRPPRSKRWRAALEVAACLTPPLIWSIGLRGDMPAHAAWRVAVGLALAFACLLELRWRFLAQSALPAGARARGTSRGHGDLGDATVSPAGATAGTADWRWLSADWRDWVWPLLAVPAALLLWAFRAPPALPAPAHWLAYLLWAMLQQLLVLAVVARRLELLAGARSWAILGAAFAFALMHTPNDWLMELTYIAELWWAWCFLRRPVLLPITIAHALAALLLQAAIGALPLRSLGIGARFLQ